MATHTSLSALFTAIADAIRAKTGSTDPIVADNFPTEIANISTGTGTPTDPEEPTEVLITASNIDSYFSVTNGDYYFAGVDSTFTSNNKGQNSTTASTTLTARCNMSIRFTYSYSSEESYDKFTLTVGGTTVEKGVSGATTEKSYSGSITLGQTIVFSYEKDNSNAGHKDQCTFKDMYVAVSGSPSGDSSSIKRLITNDESVTPTGTYASATYYNIPYGVKVGYCPNGDILISMMGGTSSSYENLYFTLASAPAGVTISATDGGTYGTANGTGGLYVCCISGLTTSATLSIEMKSRNASYDYVRCAITLA